MVKRAGKRLEPIGDSHVLVKLDVGRIEVRAEEYEEVVDPRLSIR